MLPHAQDRIDHYRRLRREAGRMLVAVDFDGTLAPIVERPAEAAALPAGLEALRRLVARPDTDVAIVSGRGLRDARGRVTVEDLYFAGNHGMEIEGPGLQRVLEDAAERRPQLERCLERLREELSGARGVEIEDKGLTASVHYRRVQAPEEQEDVVRRIRSACEGLGGLRLTEGKRVVEVRPDVEWDKGAATRFLLEAIEGELGRAVPALFLGDDRTDEDAFRALSGRGEGVVVADPPPAATAAAAFVRSPEEVAAFLLALAEDA